MRLSDLNVEFGNVKVEGMGGMEALATLTSITTSKDSSMSMLRSLYNEDSEGSPTLY